MVQIEDGISKEMGNLEYGQDDECLCCGFKGKGVGVHFQVNACRGCSGFYKRSVTLGLQFRCRRGNYQCEIKSGTKMCRFCRLQKCTKAGMTLRTKISGANGGVDQHLVNENTLTPTTSSASTAFENKQSYEPNIDNTASVIRPPCSLSSKCTSSNLSESPSPQFKKFHEECNRAINAVKSTFAGHLLSLNIYNPTFTLTCLQRMTICLQEYFPKWGMKPKEEIIINEPIKFGDFVTFKQKGFLMQSQLLMSLPEFSGLCYEEKILVFRIFWPRFSHISNVELALQVFGNDNPDCMFIIKEDIAFRIAEDNVYPTHFFEDVPDAKNKFMKPSFEFFINNLFRPIKKLKLEKIEFSFLVLQMLWSHKKRDGLSENTIYLMEKIIQLASTELHNYYVYEKGLDNYSWRLVEITKLLAESTQHAIMMRETFLMAEIFGLFEYSFIDNELSALV
uniref:Nuclear receptor domain-containing protein n=1 Tax=Rhabditophanes sp. KR3021 TaxID=114890 RepID=A0AC35TYU4_9BILA